MYKVRIIHYRGLQESFVVQYSELTRLSQLCPNNDMKYLLDSFQFSERVDRRLGTRLGVTRTEDGSGPRRSPQMNVRTETVIESSCDVRPGQRETRSSKGIRPTPWSY